MPDIASLFQASPGIGGYFAGQNQASNLATEDAQRMELQTLANSRMLQDQREMDLHPLAMKLKQLEARTNEADLPRVAAEARLKGQEADIGAATMGSAIDQKNFENRMKVHTQLGMQLGSLSQAIGANPGVPPHVALQQELQQANLPPQVIQGLMQKYANVPPQMLAKKLQEDAAYNQRQTAAYAQAMDDRAAQEAGANQRTANTNNTQLALEDKRIAAGKYNKAQAAKDAAQTWDGTVQKAMQKGARAGYAAANAAASWAQQNDMPELAAKYSAMAEQIRPQAEAETQNLAPPAGRVDPSQLGGIPVTPNKDIRPPGAASQPGVGNAGAAQPKTLADLSKMYPGVPPEKLKEAYKKKFGVELR